MADRERPHDHQLPDTGVGLARERMLAPMMVTGDGYGTRCSSVVTLTSGGAVEFVERSYQPHGVADGEVVHRIT